MPTVTAAEIERAVEQGLASEEAIVATQAEDVVVRAGPRALPKLVDGLTKRNLARRARCADLLGRIGDRRAIAALLGALQDPHSDEPVRLSAAEALCRLGAKDGVPGLIDLLESGERRLRLDASVVLRRYTHRSCGFEHDGPAAARAAAIREWRAWWTENRATFKLVDPLGP